MKLRGLPPEVQAALVEVAGAIAVKVGSSSGGDAIKALVDNFGQALDGVVRCYEAATALGEGEGRIQAC